MSNVLDIAAILAAAAVSYYLGFKEGGRVFHKNLVFVWESQDDIAFEDSALAELVEYEKDPV